ncbi:MAG: hypothetical protein V3U24_01285 [Candidatus Neomarinimicrobiota bacterium]
MKRAGQILLFLIFSATVGFLAMRMNVLEKSPESEPEENPSTVYLSYGDDELAKGASLVVEGEKHFKAMRQLTFSGQNAEAYFSADGSRLIFQAHEGDENCDQIFILDIESGGIEMVSTGAGVTTCSFFQYPHDDAIIYASTHLGGEACPAKADPTLGYVWMLHPAYDIFGALPDGSEMSRLTETYGYDAEATYAFDGNRIVYTSLASGDLEIWTMDPDGSNKLQLTDRLGYDGGAFYSHDGQKIVWRAYYPESEEEEERYLQILRNNAIKPMALQIWVMDADGSNKIQITDNEGANFSPFFFPNDNRIIFSSNLANPRGRNFDLYSIDVDGSNLEQITFYDGFDSFPMFNHDGNQLAFASNRNNQEPGETNVFICSWVD